MSNYRSGPWAEVWDGLYWRWIYLHMDELARNPRWAMMCAMARKMDPDKMARHLSVANEFWTRCSATPTSGLRCDGSLTYIIFHLMQARRQMTPAFAQGQCI